MSRDVSNFQVQVQLFRLLSFTYVESHRDYLTTLYNVCAVPWGVFSTVGVFMSTVGDILSTVGVFSTVGDIMINVGDILSTVGVFSTVGGYHEYRGGYLEYRGGCSVPWGIS